MHARLVAKVSVQYRGGLLVGVSEGSADVVPYKTQKHMSLDNSLCPPAACVLSLIKPNSHNNSSVFFLSN